MDQGLKQQLVGAAVITALAAIFVPMLFDDTVDDAGKNVSELAIPDAPGKARDVEILPLPEKQDDVAPAHDAAASEPVMPASSQSERNVKPSAEFVAEDEEAMTPAKPKLRLGERETATKPSPANKPKLASAADRSALANDAGGDEDFRPVVAEPVKHPVIQPPAPTLKPVKPTKPSENVVADAAAKPAPSAVMDGNTAQAAPQHWYLNAGSFTQKENAVALQDNLKKQGFAVSLKEVPSDKGMIFKVRIGPLLDKAKAQAMKIKLAQINVNSFVSGDE
jgi:DedD protein